MVNKNLIKRNNQWFEVSSSEIIDNNSLIVVTGIETFCYNKPESEKSVYFAIKDGAFTCFDGNLIRDRFGKLVSIEIALTGVSEKRTIIKALTLIVDYLEEKYE